MDVGIRLGVQGEKEFRNALREINQSFKILQSEMNVVTSVFGKNEKSVQSLTARNTVLNKEIDLQKEKIAEIKLALDNAANSFGENDKRTKDWQIQLNNATAKLNDMERELGDNTKALEEAGKGMEDTGKEAEDLGKEMDETGKKTSVFGDVLKASLAADAIKAGLRFIVDSRGGCQRLCQGRHGGFTGCG
jgi:chromosome segregation ATPase